MRKGCESLQNLSEELKRLRVIKALSSKRFSGRVYLVGGAIRDVALGKKPKDFDFAISDPSDISRLEEVFGKKSFVLGKKPQHAHRICLGPYTVDITILNGNVEDDLKRRDLTINAMAYDLGSQKIVDIFDGFKDLKSGIIRFTNEEVIISDPLRMLKAIRHYCMLKVFTITPELKMALAKHKAHIRKIAGERLKYEIDLILASDLAYEGLEVAEEAGLLYEVFPELYELKEFDQREELELKTLTHTLYGMKFLKKYNRISCLDEKDLVNVGYALLFHDLGKPYTFSFDKEKRVVHFFGHEKVSVEISRKIMERLRFSHSQIRAILELVQNHMWIFLLNKETPTSRATKRLILKMGDLTPSLVLLTLCDMFGTTEGKRNKTTTKVLKHSKEIMGLYKEFTKEPLPKIVDGYDLISLGFEEGPFLGEVLREIREKQLSGEITRKEDALEYARGRLKFR